jgi:hypothetical protein
MNKRRVDFELDLLNDIGALDEANKLLKAEKVLLENQLKNAHIEISRLKKLNNG